MFQGFGEKFRFIDVEGQPVANLFIDELGLLNHVVDQTVRCPVLQEPSAGRIILHCKAKGCSHEMTTNCSDLSVEFHVFKQLRVLLI